MAKPVPDLVHNERTKLLANSLDRASTAALVVGVFGPIATMAYGLETERIDFRLPTVWFATTLWLGTAVAFHLFARSILRRLR